MRSAKAAVRSQIKPPAGGVFVAVVCARLSIHEHLYMPRESLRALELHLYAAKRAGKSYRGVCKVVSARAYSSQLGVRQVYVYIAEFARAVYGKRTALNFGLALAEALFGNNESYGIAHGHVFYSELSVFVGEFGNGCSSPFLSRW